MLCHFSAPGPHTLAAVLVRFRPFSSVLAVSVLRFRTAVSALCFRSRRFRTVGLGRALTEDFQDVFAGGGDMEAAGDLCHVVDEPFE